MVSLSHPPHKYDVVGVQIFKDQCHFFPFTHCPWYNILRFEPNARFIYFDCSPQGLVNFSTTH